ncbi:shikimate dehydrogenase [Sanguibacter gelidistatuariae]|uniref:Shikimate dehydrogenase n=1 Tax=Sanguibacter gelidistatuariae TaxID=1814289 RepID=A0A1G6JSS7_9MICO|nr:shikimate dehydrogenase [Sanguibacter gelidistatuariae]SDC21809.1 shikimate dehydrogenase [Sanguibacter gelidistatuariae]
MPLAPRRAAVLGHPIAHSLSPVLHRAAYAALGLTGWEYDAVDVTSETLGAFVTDLDDSWAGLSLTMPLKQTIIALLDHIEPLAEVTGAVNTVVFSGVGAGRTLVGTNTDVYGLVTAIREGAVDSAPRGGAVVLGAGATASSTLAALAELGYPSADVYVRSLGRTGDLQRAAHRMGVTPRFHALDGAARAMLGAAVVVSTLPAHGADGVAGELGALVAAGESGVTGVLLDVCYEPRTTALAAAWSAAGGAVVGGQRMLLHQAVEQVRLMTGRVAPTEAMADALEQALAQAPTRTLEA